MNFFLFLALASLFFGAFSYVRPTGRRSLGVFLIRWVAASIVGAAAACIVLWLLVGGWGPPSPLFFACIGLVVGIWLGFVKWSGQGVTWR